MNRSIEPWFLVAFVRLGFLVLTKECSESGEGEVLNIMPWSYLVMSMVHVAFFSYAIGFREIRNMVRIHAFLPLNQGISCKCFLQPIQCKHLVNSRVLLDYSACRNSHCSPSLAWLGFGESSQEWTLFQVLVKYSNLPRVYAYLCMII